MHNGTEHNGRTRLPNRRPNHTQTLKVGGHCFEVNVGFDPATGRPLEVFLNSGKEGSLLNSILADAGVTLSLALQHGIPAAALAKSIGRLPQPKSPLAPDPRASRSRLRPSGPRSI